jgi:hypothetical protein
MPDPIPRNRSACGRPPRRPARHWVWSGFELQRPRRNVRPPEPAPPQPHPPAPPEVRLSELFRRTRGNSAPPVPQPPQPRQPAVPEISLGQPFRRPRENAGPHESSLPQPRPPARSRARSDRLSRQPRGNVGPGQYRPLPSRRSGVGVTAGLLLCAVAALGLGIAVPLLPSGTFSGAAAAPAHGHAGVAPPTDDDPGFVGDQLAVQPDASAAPEHGPIPATDIHQNLVAVHRGKGLSVTTGYSVSASQPSRPAEATNAADPGRSGPVPAEGHLNQRPDQPNKPKHQPPAGPPPANPAPKPTPQRERLEALARQFVKPPQSRNGGAGQQTGRPRNGAGDGRPTADRSQGGKAKPSSSKGSGSGGGTQGGSRSSGGSKSSSSSSSDSR